MNIDENYYAWLMLMGLFETTLIQDMFDYDAVRYDIEHDIDLLETIRSNIYFNTEWT